MKKKYIILIVCLILAGAAAYGFYYYQHNYVETVTSYYVMTYTPPSEKEDMYGFTEMSDPKIRFEKVTNYFNDSTAVSVETKKAKDAEKGYLNGLQKEIDHPDKSEKYPFMHEAKINAYKDLLSNEYIVISITHIRKFKSNDIIKEIKSGYFNEKKAEELSKKYKIAVKSYPI